MIERKTTEIKLRVSPEEKTSWQLAAEQREVGLSQFIRDCVYESLQAQWNQQTAQGLSVETLERLREKALEVASWRPAPTQPVPTSDEDCLVAKPWMFEASKRD